MTKEKNEKAIIKKAVKIFIRNKTKEVILFLLVLFCSLMFIMYIGQIAIQAEQDGFNYVFNNPLTVSFWAWDNFFMGILASIFLATIIIFIVLFIFAIYQLLHSWIESNLEEAIKEARSMKHG